VDRSSTEVQPAYPKATAIVLALLFGVYSFSFVLPVTGANTRHAMYGYQAFILSIWSVIYIPMWMANPVFWFGCLALDQGPWKRASYASLCSVLLAISELGLWDHSPEIGYYIWLSSMLLLTLTAFAFRFTETIAKISNASRDTDKIISLDSTSFRVRSAGYRE